MITPTHTRGDTMEPTTAFLMSVLAVNIGAQWDGLTAGLPCDPADRAYEWVPESDFAVGTLPDGSVFLVMSSGPVAYFRAYCPAGTYVPTPPPVAFSLAIPAYRDTFDYLRRDHIERYDVQVIDGVWSSRTCDTNGLCGQWREVEP